MELKGNYIRETDLRSLQNMKPGDYMRYVDETGKSFWMAAIPITWQNGNSIFVNLHIFGVSLDNDVLSCQRKIQAGHVARQFVWTGFLKRGIWSWEARDVRLRRARAQ